MSEKTKNILVETSDVIRKLHTTQFFSAAEAHKYCIAHVEEMHELLDRSLHEALAEMSFIDSNHGHSIMTSVIGYLKHTIPTVLVDQAELSRETFLIARLTTTMTRALFEAMVAAHPDGMAEAAKVVAKVTKPKKPRPRTKFKDLTAKKGKKT